MNLEALSPDPILELSRWLEEARQKSGLEFPNSMSLATSTPDGAPSVRMVLLKGISQQGLEFFTNFESRKGQDLAANPKAAVCFYWEKLHRQARVEGEVERLSQEESQAYFITRPRESQLGAWASPQSRVIESREELELLVQEYAEKFEEKEEIPRPPHWGGFRLRPRKIEFWINGPHRLHDRFLYEKKGNAWERNRLAP